MECDQCGARRPRTGPCPNCGAPPPGTYSSMRGWRGQGGKSAPRGSSGANWGQQGGYDQWGESYDDRPVGRSGGRNARRGQQYEDVDLERALVPTGNEMLPMQQGAGLPALPGMPTTDEEERALGIRRPAYIPATLGKRKRRLGSFRVLSGVLSVLLVCIASCGVATVFGRDRITNFIAPPIRKSLTPPTIDYSKVPGTPAATPGPRADVVKSAVTSKAVDTNFNPVDPTTQFLTGSTVYVALQVRNAPQDSKHVITVLWYVNGVFTTIRSKRDNVDPNNPNHYLSDMNASLGLQYPQPCVGEARVYWDLPDSAKTEQEIAPFLAQRLFFAVRDPAPTPVPTKQAPATTPAAASPTAPPKQ